MVNGRAHSGASRYQATLCETAREIEEGKEPELLRTHGRLWAEVKAKDTVLAEALSALRTSPNRSDV